MLAPLFIGCRRRHTNGAYMHVSWLLDGQSFGARPLG
jgi:hypothetical protein